MTTSMSVPRPSVRSEALRRLHRERHDEVRQAIGAKVYDAQMAEYYARLDEARGLTEAAS